MDWNAIINELGGGLGAVVIVALAFVSWTFWRRITIVTDARIEDHKEHTSQIMEVTRTVDTAISALKER